ncbi:hypothetical protein ACVWZP_001049 [Pseudomonas sp. TE36184]
MHVYQNTHVMMPRSERGLGEHDLSVPDLEAAESRRQHFTMALRPSAISRLNRDRRAAAKVLQDIYGGPNSSQVERLSKIVGKIFRAKSTINLEPEALSRIDNSMIFNIWKTQASLAEGAKLTDMGPDDQTSEAERRDDAEEALFAYGKSEMEVVRKYGVRRRGESLNPHFNSHARPVYAASMLFGEQGGYPGAAPEYGPIALILGDHTKRYATITSRDSVLLAQEDSETATEAFGVFGETPEQSNLHPVIAYADEEQLEYLLDDVYGASERPDEFFEVQIHDAISVMRDVERVEVAEAVEVDHNMLARLLGPRSTRRATSG